MIWFTTSSVLLSAALLPPTPLAQEQPLELHLRLRTQEGIEKALRYLVSTQRADGAWEAFGQPNPAITALVVKCLAQDAAYGREHAAVRRGLEFILRYVQPDGGIYVPDEGMWNYHTSVALMALAAAKDPARAKTIENAQQFLKKLQWDDGEGYETSSPWYGGQGYGEHKRPDLSNTQMMLEALHESGLSADDPVYQKAMLFVSRCQMLGRTNDQPFAGGAEDGGFVYTPVNGGESKAGVEMVDGKPRLRSYGSMTYAGFKSLLYAKVDRNDDRVRGAVDWIRRNFTLDHNPNMPQAQSKEGLYYCYHVFARALHAWGEEVINDAQGMPHRWRAELCEKLLALQRDDGYWINEEDRWYEGNPSLVTAYAVLALQTALSQ
jgi:squalene-hopene/tetraprenyl-beta-curcumene cyclase